MHEWLVSDFNIGAVGSENFNLCVYFVAKYLLVLVGYDDGSFSDILFSNSFDAYTNVAVRINLLYRYFFAVY